MKFNVGGVSTHKGDTKVRFCSDLVIRVKNLQKQGDTNIRLINLPFPMTKVEICQYLITKQDFVPFHSDIRVILEKKVRSLKQKSLDQSKN